MDALGADHQELQASIGQHMVDIRGVKFESLRQTTAWITSNLTSGSYHVFMNVNTLLDALGSSHLYDKDFIDEKYHAQKGKFEKKSSARVTASFGKDIPTVFGKVDSSSVVGASSSPLSTVKTYFAFNVPESHSGVKQRILDEMQNIFASITSDISSRIAGLPQALMLAKTFLLNSREAVDFLLTWMDSFIQELKTGG